MKWSKTHLYTLREAPSDAEIPSHQLMIRAGMIKKLAPGIYTYGQLALRSIRKIENIIREEMDKEDCCEVLMPMVQPAELWRETNRWDEMGEGLAKFTNRNGHEFCLGATHEEAITDYVRNDLNSYKNLPKIIYQIQTKFRDEIRPRFGLMRGREFIMKDAYSFDLDKDSSLLSYDRMYECYCRIFDRLGFEYRVVKADSGSIGGDKSQEFHALASNGEDLLMVSTESDFAANIEVCPAVDMQDIVYGGETENELEEFATPDLKTISDLSKSLDIEEKFLVKTMFFSATDDVKKDGVSPICILLRGSDEVNAFKIKNHFGLSNPPMLLSDEEVLKLTGASPGSCGPIGINVPIYLDTGLCKYKNFITGANKDNFHIKNVNPGRDFKVKDSVDFRMAKEGDKSPDGKGVLKAIRGIELGHIFYLGTKYSKQMKLSVLNQNGKAVDVEMGCYGLGVSRTVQATIEQSHDKDGIIWPKSIAPFQVHVCHLDPKDEKVNAVVEEIVGSLQGQNIDVFVDDRKERPGVKFKDADLLGFPVRITVGGKGVASGVVEIVERKNQQKNTFEISKAAAEVLKLIK